MRKVHDAPPMTFNEEMAKSATAYAEKLAKMGTLQHSSRSERNGDGENLAMACSSEDKGYAATDPTGAWYIET